jgi:flagellar biosynthesis/type III secretory pathway M-ring protein FliF/YscJ
MSTGAIIAIVVAALIIIAVVAFLLMRSRSQERQLAKRREEVAGAHREVADQRMAEADRAERIARAERAEAELHASRADLHEQGLADDELDTEHRRFVRDRDDDTVTDDTTTRDPGRSTR